MYYEDNQETIDLFLDIQEIQVPMCNNRSINFYVKIQDKKSKCVNEFTNFLDKEEVDNLYYIKGDGLGNCSTTGFNVESTQSLSVIIKIKMVDGITIPFDFNKSCTNPPRMEKQVSQGSP